MDFSRAQHNELIRLRRTLASGEASLVETNRSGSEARLASSRSALRAANESGDSDLIAKAQEEMAQAVNEQNRWKDYRPVHQVDQNDPRMQPAPQRQPQPQERYQPPRPTPEASDWHEKNPWFQNDDKMTAYAFGVHADLIKSGVEPDSKDYYKKLDTEMVRVFPSSFSSEVGDQRRQNNASSRKATVVASSSRSGGTPRKVKLTTTQVSLAKRLGITPEQYARELLKQEAEAS